MNTNHYPSLENCKKFKEIGFLDTKKEYKCYLGKPDLTKIIDKHTGSIGIPEAFYYPCPSIAEMLDVMPKVFSKKFDNTGENNYLIIEGNSVYYRDFKGIFDSDTLPNALADMVIWLVENKYLSFNK